MRPGQLLIDWRLRNRLAAASFLNIKSVRPVTVRAHQPHISTFAQRLKHSFETIQIGLCYGPSKLGSCILQEEDTGIAENCQGGKRN